MDSPGVAPTRSLGNRPALRAISPSMTLALLHRLPRLHGSLLLHLIVKAAIVCGVAALLTYIVHRVFKLAGCALAAMFLFFCVCAVVLKAAAVLFLHR
jgi:hypothetical protein